MEEVIIDEEKEEEKNKERYKEIESYILGSNYGFEELEKQGLLNYMIMNFIAEYGANNEQVIKKVKEYYSRFRINDDRFIIVADSHVGRIPEPTEDDYELEEFDSIYDEYDCNPSIPNTNLIAFTDVYKYAFKNGIKSIIHLGDLIEGNSDDKIRHMRIVNNQIKHLKEIYEPNGINTYLLYGNHDLNAIGMDSLRPDFYKEFENFELIGSEIGYIHIGDCFVKLTHLPIRLEEQAPVYKNIEFKTDFELSGHSHIYRIIKDWLLKVPPIAGVRDSHTELESCGFLVAENRNNEILFRKIRDDVEDKQQIAFDKKEKKLILKSTN